MAQSSSNRIIATPSAYAKSHYLYVQEVGTLQSLESHISKRQNLNSHLIFAVLNGSGIISREGLEYSITAGDCVWLDCNTPYFHQSSNEEPWTLMWVHFYGASASFFYQYFLHLGHSFIFKPEHFPGFTEILSQLYRNQQEKSSLTELISNKYLTDLVTFCFTQGQSDSPQASSTSEKLQQIHTYLEDHYHEKISLESLSARFYLSKYHLSREYKRLYGITLMGDLTAKRISRGKELLRFTNDSVESIAQQCGYPDLGYFIKVFKKAEMMTPLEYRKLW